MKLVSFDSMAASAQRCWMRRFSPAIIACLLFLNALADEPPSPLITIDLEGEIRKSIAIASDGTLYVSVDPKAGGASGSRLVALTPAGEVLWDFPFQEGGSMGLSSAAVDEAGHVYFGGPDGKIYALRQNGTKKWDYDVGMGRGWRPVGAPAITGDGLVLMATSGGFMVALNQEGKLLWRTQASCNENSSPAIGPEGTIYFLNNSGLSRLSPNGTLDHAFNLKCSNFVLNGDGTILFRYLQPWSLAKFDPEQGKILWTFEKHIMPQAAVGPANQIYFIAVDGIYAVSPEGARLEHFDFAARDWPIHAASSPPLCIAADGSIFAGVRGNFGQGFESKLLKLAPDFSSHIEYELGPGTLTPVALGPDGTAYAGNSDGKLFIIPNDSPLPKNGWPSARRDAAQTANLSSPSPRPQNLEQLSATTGEFAAMVRLSWKEPAVFSILEILRGTTPDQGEATVLAENFSGAAHYDDRSVQPDQTYYYWIRPRNSAGAADYSGPVAGNSAPGTRQLWSVEIPLAAPAIGPDGTLYANGLDNNLYALSPANGEIKWSFPGIHYSPVISDNGWVIALSHSEMFALDQEGSLQWKVENVSGMGGSLPAIGKDHTIYWATGPFLKAYTADGQEKWTFETDDLIRGDPAIALDGTILFATRQGKLQALHPDGSPAWDLEIGTETASPVIAFDGRISLLGYDSIFHSIDPTGAIKWSAPFPGSYFAYSGHVISPAGTIIAPGVYGLNPEDGSQIWNVVIPSRSPAVARDGTVLAGGQKLTAIAPDGTVQWEYEPLIQNSFPGIGVSDPVLSANGVVYVRAAQSLVAIQTSHLASEEGWTMFRGNAQRTGRVLAKASQPRMSARLEENGAVMLLEISPLPEVPIEIEYSEDLRIWKSLPVQEPKGVFREQMNADEKSRFYRLLLKN